MASTLPDTHAATGAPINLRRLGRVRVLDEIPHGSFAAEPVEAVTEAVRERFVAALGQDS